MNKNDDSDSIFTCGCGIAVLIFNALAGGWSVYYLLGIFGKPISFFFACLIGLIVGEVSVPVAVVVWLLKLSGVI